MEMRERYRLIGSIMKTMPVIEGRIGRVMNEKFSRIAEEECDKLTRLQLLTLFLIIHKESIHQEKMSMTRIAKNLRVSAQQATRLVDGLIKAGVAERYQEPENRRLVLIRPTKEGRAYMRELKAKALPLLGEAFNNISDEQLQKLNECFNTIYEILNTDPKPQCGLSDAVESTAELMKGKMEWHE